MNILGMFSHKPTLENGQAKLRPFTPADIQAMGPILADPEVLRLTGSVHTTAEANSISPHLDPATRAWYETRADQAYRLDLAIIDPTTHNCVGEAVLNDLDAANNSCNFRILIGGDGRDRGIGSAAIRLLQDHAFSTTDLNRIELEVFAFNPRARQVYERCGFIFEGLRRAAHKFDGEYIDAIMMSMLRSDWESEKNPR